MTNKGEDAIDALVAALIVFCVGVVTAGLVWLIVLAPLVLLPVAAFAAIWYAFYTHYQS